MVKTTTTKRRDPREGGSVVAFPAQSEVTELHKALETELLERGHPDRAAVMKGDKVTEYEFIGVRLPGVREAIKKWAKLVGKDPEFVLPTLSYIWNNSSYFEVLSACLEYLHKREKLTVESWKVLLPWSQRVDNWDHADSLGRLYATALEFSSERQQIYTALLRFNKTDSTWLKRLSLVGIKRYSGKNAIFLSFEEMSPLVSRLIDDPEYYVQTAVGWVLRDMRVVYPQETDYLVAKSIANIGDQAFSRFLERHSSKEKELFYRLRRSA